jgi:hypothetical protein
LRNSDFKRKIAIGLAVVIFANIILIGIASDHSANAQSQPVFNTPINITGDPDTATTPNIQSVGSNVYVVWEQIDRGVSFRSSPDGGATWNPPLTEPALRLSSAGGTIQDPLISANGSNVYVTWSETITNGHGQPVLEVFEATSTDYGLSFNTAVQLTTGDGYGGGRNAIPGYITSIPASWGNNVYITYASGNNSFVTCSNAAGAPGTWTPAFHYGDAREDQVAAWGGKYVYVTSDDSLWVSNNNCAPGSWSNHTPHPGLGSETWIETYGPNVYDAGEGKGNTSVVHYVYSNNYGQSWSRTQALSKTLYDAWAPMVWAHGNDAWIAVHTFPGGLASQVYVYTSTDAGRSWSAPVVLSSPPKVLSDTSFPFTVASSDGQDVFVAWAQQIPPGYWQFNAAYSSNGGQSWTPPPGIDISLNAKGSNASSNNDLAVAGIAASGPYCFAAYQFTNRTSSQIYFATNDNSPPSTTAQTSPSVSVVTSVSQISESTGISSVSGTTKTTTTSGVSATVSSTTSIQFSIPSSSGSTSSIYPTASYSIFEAVPIIAIVGLAMALALVYRRRRLTGPAPGK